MIYTIGRPYVLWGLVIMVGSLDIVLGIYTTGRPYFRVRL